MTIHRICFYPEPVLLKEAETVDVFDDALRVLVADMFETMYDAKGVGLAAPQIGISKRIFVIDSIGDGSERIVMINPVITQMDDMTKMQEGCLSVPGPVDYVRRANKVKATGVDEFGKPVHIEAEGLLAEAIQHETDHLHGKLYIHKLSPLKRMRALKALEKTKKTLQKK